MVTKKVVPKFDIRSYYAKSLDEIERYAEFESALLETNVPVSTGLLVYDLLLGGGLRHGWYTNFGKEQSCKTTSTLCFLASAIKQGVPNIYFVDYEGSSDSRDYIASVLKTMGVTQSFEQIFGKRNDKTGEWITRPIVRFRSETVGEKFFYWALKFTKSLPDKRQVNKKWWYVFENTKTNITRLAGIADRDMGRKYGHGLWVEAEDGKQQALIIVDSYPFMSPTMLEDDLQTGAMAVQARMFAKYVGVLKGKLASKQITIVGVNHLRDVPGAKYGPSEKETCGNALQQASDVRIKHVSRSSGYPFGGILDKDDRLEHEASVNYENGIDRYRYICIETPKNKKSPKLGQAWLRLWTNNAVGIGSGFDPFFDTVYYLHQTGQLSAKNRKNITLHIRHPEDGSKEWAPPLKPLSWMDIKTWVLGDRDARIEICKQAGLEKPFDLRALCFGQLRSGVGHELYSARHNRVAGSSIVDNDDEETDDE